MRARTAAIVLEAGVREPIVFQANQALMQLSTAAVHFSVRLTADTMRFAGAANLTQG